jgi:hypothetical protein
MIDGLCEPSHHVFGQRNMGFAKIRREFGSIS